jgi:hypothetical protein
MPTYAGVSFKKNTHLGITGKTFKNKIDTSLYVG